MAHDEIERRFLVDLSKINLEHLYRYSIEQGYLDTDPTSHVTRIRKINTNGMQVAYLTLKTRVSKGINREYEYEIPVSDATELLLVCGNVKLTKSRYLFQDGPETPLVKSPFWEIDLFSGDLDGIVIAEIELPSIDYEFELPDFVTKEITGIHELSNYRLAKYPEVALATIKVITDEL